jgi:hypothetical protein
MKAASNTRHPASRACTLAGRVTAFALTALVAAGCATPNVACSIRGDYATTAKIPAGGAVLLTWGYDAELPGKHGDVLCVDGPPRQCHVRIAGEAPSFNNVCGLAIFAHETLLHGMGAAHD